SADPVWVWDENYNKLGLAAGRGFLFDHLRCRGGHLGFSLFVSLWAAQGRAVDQEIQPAVLRLADSVIGLVVSGGEHPARGLWLYGQPLSGPASGYLAGYCLSVFCWGKGENHLYSGFPLLAVFAGLLWAMGCFSSQ